MITSGQINLDNGSKINIDKSSMKLAEISIKRPSLVIVLFTLLTLGGLVELFYDGYELIPKFETNMVTISTVYPELLLVR